MKVFASGKCGAPAIIAAVLGMMRVPIPPVFWSGIMIAYMGALLQSTAGIIRVCQAICKVPVHDKVPYNRISISYANLTLAARLEKKELAFSLPSRL